MMKKYDDNKQHSFVIIGIKASAIERVELFSKK